MLFRQKERVPDVGKDNFREFMRREQDSCMNTQMKLSTFVHKTVPNDQSKQNLLNSALDGSLNTVGNTWDAKHLSTFLQKSQFACVGDQALKITEPFQNSFKNQSFFFRSQQPRIINDQVDYFHQHPINHLISDYPLMKNSNEFLQKKMLSLPDQTYGDIKPNYHNKLQSPKEQFLEMKNIKEQQSNYKQWKQDYGDVNKAYKKAKLGSKSGLYAFDNPLNKDTNLYKEEYQQIKLKQDQSQRNYLQRYRSLEKFNTSNPAIEFDNQNSNNQSIVFPHQNYEIDAKWKSKKFHQQSVDTQSRLFGDEVSTKKVNSQRTQNLRYHETGGKNYNVVNLTRSIIG